MDNQGNANYPINPMQNLYFNSPLKNSSPQKMQLQGRDDKYPSQISLSPFKLNIIDLGGTPLKKKMDYNSGYCQSLGETPLINWQFSPVINHQIDEASLQKSQYQNRGQIYDENTPIGGNYFSPNNIQRNSDRK